MKSFPRYTAAVIVALAVAGAVGIAKANPMMHGGMGGPMGHMCGDMDARMAAKAAYAEVKLGLSDPQKAELKKLTATMKAAHEPMTKLCAEQQSAAAAAAPATLPSRMQEMLKMQEVKVETMRKVVPAMTQFYKSLTPDQQKIADSMMMGHHGRHMGHH